MCYIGIAVEECVDDFNRFITPFIQQHIDDIVNGESDWSSVVLAFENSKKVSEEVKKPKALGDIRGVSYIYPILWRFGMIRVPEAIEKKMGKRR